MPVTSNISQLTVQTKAYIITILKILSILKTLETCILLYSLLKVIWIATKGRLLMREFRKVKIIATLGPASNTLKTIKRLIIAGTNVFRFNMSHGDIESQRAIYMNVRQAEKELRTPIGTLVDLQGPKLRIGTFSNKTVSLSKDQEFILDLSSAQGCTSRVTLPHPEIFQVIQEGNIILLNDGKIKLQVTKINPEQDKLYTRVLVAGELSDNKGLNVPDVELPVSALSQKDVEHIEWARSLDFDWIALSFVQRPDDISETRKIIGNDLAIIAKIEKPQAVAKIDKILDTSDGIMIARGDLGVELPMEQVPIVQKELIGKARIKGKPVVVATQMMESMISSIIPTRAESSDVANAIYEGADAIMLSAESATGKYPVETVRCMDRIARAVERDPFYRHILDTTRSRNYSTAPDAITAAAREVAETAQVKVICTFTCSGTTALRCAKERPRVPIMALTPLEKTARKLTLVWGLLCVMTENVTKFSEALQEANSSAQAWQFAKTGDYIIVTAGVPFNTPGSTNILRMISACDYILDTDL